MKLQIVILGLSIRSSWGNGHATVYRGLARELTKRGHDVLFLERDKPWYAAHRDKPSASWGKVSLYQSVDDLKKRFADAIHSADFVMVGSYLPEGIEIGKWVTGAAEGITGFYDIDTPVTQSLLSRGKCEYLSPDLIPRYSLYLSFTGGPILQSIERNYGAPVAKAFYCCVDPDNYYPEAGLKQFDLGYIGTYGRDRQPGLERLLLTPASLHKKGSFIVAGPMYPDAIQWPANVRKVDHVPPAEHREFYNAQRFTLNITRADMVRWGFSPSVRLFEAAACGIPIITDEWPGLGEFLRPGKEILTAHSANEVLEYLNDLGAQEAQTIADNARRRILSEHTAAHRAEQLEALITGNGNHFHHNPQRKVQIPMKCNGNSNGNNGNSERKKIRVAIIGVGNCASSLVQGVHFYRDIHTDEMVPGLMHPTLGGYRIADIQFTAAFDVNETKVGRDLSEAIFAKPNNTMKFSEPPPSGVRVQRGMVHDGIGRYLKKIVKIAGGRAVDVAGILKQTQTDVVISYLPVGSEIATRWYAEQILEAGCAFVNCIPVFIASEASWRRRFESQNLPLIGDDIKSQLGATIVHRVLTNLFRDRGVKLERTYQLNFGGNTDFLNMLERERLESKKISKTQAVISQADREISKDNVHIGPSDYVPWMADRKFCHIRMEGTTFGNAPINCELKLEVWDSPNSAGVVIDAIRCAKLALDRGLGGALIGPSAYFMKSPPKQFNDNEAREEVEKFILGEPKPVSSPHAFQKIVPVHLSANQPLKKE